MVIVISVEVCIARRKDAKAKTEIKFAVFKVLFGLKYNGVCEEESTV